MALCINQSGTYRNITTLCINQSGTYRNITTGCINDSGTYRLFLCNPALGASYEGGFLICKQAPNLRWVVSPCSAEVSRIWNAVNDSNTCAQSVSGCTGWFVPTCSQLLNPGYACRSFWGPSPCYCGGYWSSTSLSPSRAALVNFDDGTVSGGVKFSPASVRSFRCVTY